MTRCYRYVAPKGAQDRPRRGRIWVARGERSEPREGRDKINSFCFQLGKEGRFNLAGGEGIPGYLYDAPKGAKMLYNDASYRYVAPKGAGDRP